MLEFDESQDEGRRKVVPLKAIKFDKNQDTTEQGGKRRGDARKAPEYIQRDKGKENILMSV
jgi:hypothetical protein